MTSQLGHAKLGVCNLGTGIRYDFAATLNISCILPAVSDSIGIFRRDSLLGRATLGSLQLGATLTNVLTPEVPLNIYLSLTANVPTSVIYGLIEI